MIETAKEIGRSQPGLPGKCRTLWAWLCIIVVFCLAGSQAEAFFTSSQNAACHSEAAGNPAAVWADEAHVLDPDEEFYGSSGSPTGMGGGSSASDEWVRGTGLPRLPYSRQTEKEARKSLRDTINETFIYQNIDEARPQARSNYLSALYGFISTAPYVEHRAAILNEIAGFNYENSVALEDERSRQAWAAIFEAVYWEVLTAGWGSSLGMKGTVTRTIGTERSVISTVKTPMTPSAFARGQQGSGLYPGVDRFRDITLQKGTIIYGGAPGQSAFYTTGSAVRRAGDSATDIFQGLQVAPHPVHGYRPAMTAYEVMDDSQPPLDEP